MIANLFTLNSSKTEFLLIGLKQQLCKIQDCSLTTTHSARNFGFIFDEHLTFSGQITALSKSCYYHIRELRCIRPYLDFKTASTKAESKTYTNDLHDALMLKNNTAFWQCWRSKFELQSKCSQFDGCVDPEIIADKFLQHFKTNISCNNTHKAEVLKQSYLTLWAAHYSS